MGIVGDLRLVGSLLLVLAATYLVTGLFVDTARALSARASTRARGQLATVLVSDEQAAAVAAERLARTSAAVLIPLIQRLAADLDGQADDRLRRLVGSTGLAGRIGRRSKSRRWRRRAQAAALAPLLPQDDPRRRHLLRDRHPMVRARAALHLENDDAVEEADQLLRLLGDPSPAVRFAAQQALLRSDGRIIEPLRVFLADEQPGVGLALEVAANMADPRLHREVRILAGSSNPDRRALATAALDAEPEGIALLHEALADEHPAVRVAAAAAAHSLGDVSLCPDLGERLSDRSWEVRLEAGRALAALGPVGALTLRHHVFDRDPYARDMARRTLDDIEAHEGRPVAPVQVPIGLDAWSPESAA